MYIYVCIMCLIDECLQVRVKVYDRGRPDHSVVCRGMVGIVRNAHPPNFSQSSYEAWISEYHTPGTIVTNVTAVDDDGVSVLSRDHPRSVIGCMSMMMVCRCVFYCDRQSVTTVLNLVITPESEGGQVSLNVVTVL